MKRTLALLLALMMVLSLAACGGTESEAPASSEEPAPASSEAEKEPESADPVHLVSILKPPSNFQPTDPEVLEQIHQKILDDTGADLEVIVGPVEDSDYQTKQNLMLSGGEQLDMFIADGAKRFYDQGLTIDLTDLVKEYGKELIERNGDTMKYMEWDGKILCLPRMADLVTWSTFLRQDWLDKYNLEVPHTIEDFEKVLEVFKTEDPAGNGQTIPLLGDMQLYYSLAGAWIPGGWGMWEDEDGTMKPPYLDPGFKDFVTKMNEWYEKGYFPKDIFVRKGTDDTDAIKSGIVGGSALWYSRITLHEGFMQQAHPEASFVNIGKLEGPAGLAQTACTMLKLPGAGSAAGGVGGYMITSQCKAPEVAMKVLNWFCVDDNYLYAKYGPDGYKITGENKEKGYYTYDVIKDQLGDEYQSLGKGPANDMAFAPSASTIQRHWDFLVTNAENRRYDEVKFPLDSTIKFDAQALNNAVPTYADILRVVDENFVSFVTGKRPISEYDAFQEELKAVGVDTLIEEMNRQYNELK